MENELLVSAKCFLKDYDVDASDYDVSKISDLDELNRLKETSIGLDFGTSSQIKSRVGEIKFKKELDKIKLKVNVNDYNKLMRVCQFYDNLSLAFKDRFNSDIKEVREKMVELNKIQLPSIVDYTELIKRRKGTFHNHQASEQIEKRIIEINKNCSDLNLLRRRLSEERAYCRATNPNKQEVLVANNKRHRNLSGR